MPDFPVLRMPAPPIITPWSLESVGGLQNSPLFSSVVVPASAAWPTANLAIFVPFTLYEPFPAVKMVCYNGATNGNNVDAGIYLPDGTRVVSMGSTAQGTINVLQEFNIADTLLPGGDYYMALACDGTTSTFFQRTTAVQRLREAGIFEMAAAFPLPATATFVGAVGTYFPVFGVSQRSLII